MDSPASRGEKMQVAKELLLDILGFSGVDLDALRKVLQSFVKEVRANSGTARR